MLTETLNSTSKNDNNMELDNSVEESTDDDDEEEFPPLPSDIDFPSYANTPDPYDNSRTTREFLFFPSPPLPSPPQANQLSPAPASSENMIRILTNSRTVSTIRSHDTVKQKTVSFATQQKKKTRIPICDFLEGVYVNISTLKPLKPAPPPPPPTATLPLPLSSSGSPESITVPNEVTYATLMNTTSMGLLPTNSDTGTIHAHYQEINIHNKSVKTNQSRIYENIKARRPPPPPYYSQKNFFKRTSSVSSTATSNPEISRSLIHSQLVDDDLNSCSNAHIYINLEFQDDKPPIIPTRSTKKQAPIIVQKSLTPPSPPVIPPRGEQKEDTRSLISTTGILSIEKEQNEEDTNAHETSSNASSVQVSCIISIREKKTKQIFIHLDSKRT